ncbi:MAG: hypothetical protein ACI8PD_000545 [Nitrospinales bacterium]|jgi:hypothetical protein
MKTQKLIQIFILALLVSLCSNSFNLAWAIENKSRVVSSYWQSDSTSYSFISVTHSSLSGLASQIGLVVNAIQGDQTAFGAAVTFTISAGTTQRIFIARSNHSFLSAAIIPTASFIIGTSSFKHGHIRIEPVASNPAIVAANTPSGRGFRDITMLNFWGAIVIESNTTGFAMEFIGDMHDSAATPSMDSSAPVSGVN